MGASLNAPNKDIPGETIRPIKALLDRGYKVSRLTGDLGYAQLGAEKYQKPMRDLGVPVLMGFKKDQLGVKGGVGGTLQVEGDHLCPSTPTNLVNASVDHANGVIDDETWAKRTKERQKYKTRRKEKPDASGHYPMMCPAYGPQATVECPLRKVHPNSSKKIKPAIDESALPEARDRICTQTSVDFGPDDGVERRQALPFGTEEWQLAYTHDRQLIESSNDFLKSGPESLDNPKNRRLRGLAAQQFIAVTAAVSANFRRIATFVAERRRVTPKKQYPRGRDIRGLSDYVRRNRSRDEGVIRLPEAPVRT
jgi:hypothetical protein